MGLREKVALAAILAISTQILFHHCMPHANYPLVSCTKNEKSPELFRFPDVEYPSDFEAEEYYRFRNEYPICTNNSVSITPNYKREAKLKRKCDMATNVKAKPEIATSITERDSVPHPYCFRKSSFFPDVEYPLSAKDTWIPKYWSRLQDAERNSYEQKNIASTDSAVTQHLNDDNNYNNSPLSSLIKALNTKKDSADSLSKKISATPNSDSNFIPICNEGDSFTGETVINSGDGMNSDVDPAIFIPSEDIISTVNNTTYTDINGSTNINVLCDIVTTTINSGNSDPSYIPGENNLIPITTNAANNIIELETSVSNKQPLECIITPATENNDPDLYLPGKVIQNNTVSQVSNNDTSLPPSITSDTTINPINEIDCVEAKTDPMYKETKGLFDNVVQISTNVTGDDFKPNASLASNDSFIDNYTTPGFNPESSVTKKEQLSDSGNINTINTCNITPEVSQLTECTDDVITSDIICDIPKLKEDERPSVSNVTATNKINNDTQPDAYISKNDLLGNTSTTNLQDSGVLAESLVPIDNKTLFDNTSSPNISSNKTEMTNTKNNNKLPAINESTGSGVVSNDTDSTNEVIKSKPDNGSQNENFSDIVPTMTNTKNSDSNPFQKTPMIDKATLCSAQIVPGQDESSYGNTISTTSEEFSTQKNITSVDSATTSSVLPTSPQIYLDNNTQPNNDLKNLTNGWVMGQDVVQIVPECSDDWIIYVNDEYTCDDSSRLLFDTGNTTQDLKSNGFEPIYIMVASNSNEGSIPEANDSMGLILCMEESNSTVIYEFVDDASELCTEMPYDIVVYPEYVNDTWSAFANDTYVLYDPIGDYSDDICLLFIDTNCTIPSGNII